MLLSDDADIEYQWGLQEVGDDVNVEQEIGFEPGEDEEDPSDAHYNKHQCKHNETEMRNSR